MVTDAKQSRHNHSVLPLTVSLVTGCEGSSQILLGITKGSKFLHNCRSHLGPSVCADNVRYSSGSHDACDECNEELLLPHKRKRFQFTHAQKGAMVTDHIAISPRTARETPLTIDDYILPWQLGEFINGR